MFPWVEWLRLSIGDVSVRDVASQIGYSKSAVSRYLRTEKPPAEVVIAVSVSYGLDVLVGLVVAGYISREYVESGVEERLQHVPARFLLAELARRSEGEQVPPGVPPELDPSL